MHRLHARNSRRKGGDLRPTNLGCSRSRANEALSLSGCDEGEEGEESANGPVRVGSVGRSLRAFGTPNLNGASMMITPP